MKFFDEVNRAAKNLDRQKLFDEWAKTYDQDLADEDSFPFTGYESVLDRILVTAKVAVSHSVLDLGIGTGNLAKRLHIPDRQIWGVDFSNEMLAKAGETLPGAHLLQADLADGDWMLEFQQPFDRILSAYTLHEFPDEEKVALLLSLAEKCLEPDGWIVIGDISFMNKPQFDWARQHFADLWDEDEFYWCAEPLTRALCEVGFSVEYTQVSICAGVYLLSFITG